MRKVGLVMPAAPPTLIDAPPFELQRSVVQHLHAGGGQGSHMGSSHDASSSHPGACDIRQSPCACAPPVHPLVSFNNQLAPGKSSCMAQAFIGQCSA